LEFNVPVQHKHGYIRDEFIDRREKNDELPVSLGLDGVEDAPN